MDRGEAGDEKRSLLQRIARVFSKKQRADELAGRSSKKNLTANKSFQDSDRAGPSGRARPTQEHTPEARPGQEPSMQAQYSPSTQRAPQEAQGIINWGSYSIYLEPHKLRWILRWLEKQPTPKDMEDVSDIRGANGELKDCVAALHYVESVSSSEGDAGDDTTLASGGPRSHGRDSARVHPVDARGAPLTSASGELPTKKEGQPRDPGLLAT